MFDIILLDSIKVTEHSFQVPMHNSPLLLTLYALVPVYFARVKVNPRSIYSCILAMVRAAAMATRLVKNKLLKMVFDYLINIQSLEYFHHLPTKNLDIKSLLSKLW